jgi:uncharacterized membrane protein YfcA
MGYYLLLIGFGIFVGVFSGLMGLGGGAVMIPIMVLAMGLEQAKAHGMSLMVMIPPVALPAVIGYFRGGKLETADIWTAAFISFGLLCGSYFGAQVAIALAKHKGALATCFGILLVYVAVYTALGKENVTRSAVLALVVTLVVAAVILGVKWMDAKNRTADAAASNAVSANTSGQIS